MEGVAPGPRLAAGAVEVAAAVCRLRDGAEVHELVGELWVRDGDGFAADAGPVRVRLRVETGPGWSELTLSARADPGVQVEAIGLRLRLLRPADPAWAIFEGYQSWDAAGVAPWASAPASWWRLGIADQAGTGVALVAGGAERHVTRFEIRADCVTWLQTAPAWGETPRPVWCSAASEEFTSEALRAASGEDARAALASSLPELRRRQGTAPQGWLSWYHHGVWVDAAAVVANSALLPLKPAVVQIDDGWQRAYGEWEPNTKFPDLAGLSRELRGRGQTPGIWTAPFLVSAGADLAGSAPEAWFLRDLQTGGRLRDPRQTMFGPMYVLDPRQPAVRDHLQQLFARLRGLGFRHFKIDFLYAGAYAGVDALRAGLLAIRRGAGDDAYLLACGAPLLAVAGLADGCRIGPDTCTPWPDPATGEPQPTFFGDEVLNVVRNVAARSDLGAWFQTDPDAAVAGGTLSVAQARQLITAVALCGGLYFLSDDLRTLAPERRRLAADLELAQLAAGGPARPDWDPTPDGLPGRIWRRGDGVVAVFNPTGAPLERELAAPSGRPGRDLWTGERLRAEGGVLTIQVEPQGVRLIRFGGGY